MAYYPQSQIKTNLYTSGTESEVLYTTPDYSQVYVGYYYEVSNGNRYTGKTPQDGENSLLFLGSSRITELDVDPVPTIDPLYFFEPDTVPTDENGNVLDSNIPLKPIVKEYTDINNISVTQVKFLPNPNPTIPTEKDYNLGEFQRYFAKKNNENIYLEINKETCDKLKNKDPKITFNLYTAINLSWDLSGEKDQTYLINKNTVTLIEERRKWYGFTQWFKDDFLKYYKSQDIEEDLFTDGTEFINRRTKLAYRGPYHIHPEKGPMVGAKHIQREHDYLDPIQQTLDTTPTSQPSPTPLPTPTYSGGGGSTSGGGGGYSGGGGGY